MSARLDALDADLDLLLAEPIDTVNTADKAMGRSVLASGELGQHTPITT